ncbi:MAG TPA: hypothetical protein VG425_03755 [Casimicrobiaceae bacterium]|jgi:hypothetical protein|nr:hypothetical protein [Casimicrobiaceae bacterium]
MLALRRAACVVLAAASFLAPQTQATSFSTDQSDLWYIAGESGWGLQLVQRASIVFATLYVYGPTGEPIWYTATLDYTASNTWTGILYATTGPYFATVPFNPMLVGYSPVGTMTWAAQTAETGTLTYSVSGTMVVKNMVRQLLVLDDFSGHYAGGFHKVVTGCTNATLNGTSDVMGTIDVTQDGTTISIVETFPATGSSCTYSGTLSQAGQMGSAQLSFNCIDSTGGTGSIDQMQVTPYAISGSFSATYTNPAGCQSSGWFGGFRGTTF